MSGYHALLLAAGAGSRFGGRKLLAPWRGEPLVRAAACVALAAPVETCIAVTGCDAQAVEDALDGLGKSRLVTVRAADWGSGLSSSLRAGVDAVPTASRGVVVFLGDMPLVPSCAAALLLGALDRGAVGAEMRHRGRPAHPVAFGRALFDDLRALGGDQGGRHLLAGRQAVVCFDTQDRGAVFDVDHVEDLGSGLATASRG